MEGWKKNNVGEKENRRKILQKRIKRMREEREEEEEVNEEMMKRKGIKMTENAYRK